MGDLRLARLARLSSHAANANAATIVTMANASTVTITAEWPSLLNIAFPPIVRTVRGNRAPSLSTLLRYEVRLIHRTGTNARSTNPTMASTGNVLRNAILAAAAGTIATSTPPNTCHLSARLPNGPAANSATMAIAIVAIDRYRISVMSGRFA